MAVAGLLLSSFVGGQAASAETQVKSPETFVGSAAGQALVLKIGENGVSAGNSAAKLDSLLNVLAEGQGALNIGAVGLGGTPKVTAKLTGEGSDTPAQACGPNVVPGQLSSVLTLATACGSASAVAQNGVAKAIATGTVADLDLMVNTLLQQVDAATPAPVDLATLQPVITTLLGTLDTVNKTIDNLDGPGGTVPDLVLDDTLADLLQRLQSTKTLDLRIGASTSEVTSAGDLVTSNAVSAGGVISLLPVSLPMADGTIQVKPLVEIVIGSAKATSVYNRATGVSTPSFDPAIVTIRVNTPTTDVLNGRVLGLSVKELKITPDLSAIPNVTVPGVSAVVVQKCADAPNEFCVLPGTPLETRIAIASGRTVTNADGSVGAIADAVKIHALKNIGSLVAALNGGIRLELAHAEAGVGGKPAELLTVAAPEIPRELPRTGGTPWMPIVGIAGLALAVLTRRALVRSN